MTIELTLVLLGIVVCLILSNFFSGSEMAFSSCNKIRLESEKDAGNKQAKTALKIVDRFDDALGAILIGNNLVNIASSSLGSVAIILIFKGDDLAFLSTIILTILVIIFGETIPKITCKKAATRYALRYAYPVRILMIIFKPLLLIIVGLVKLLTLPFKGEKTEKDQDEAVEELQSIIETAEVEEVLDEDQSELVQAAIDFADVSASEAMTARVDVTALDIDDSWEENLQLIENASFTRLPVYEGSIDNVIGVLYMNHFLKALTENERVDIRSLLMKPCYVYKTIKLPEVMDEFRKAKQHLAIVVDEYGGTLGVITMEDVLEKMVGEIWDETDTVETEVREIAEGEYEIDGDMPIGDFLEMMEISEDDFDYESETVGGWTVEMFGAFPKAGESFTYQNVKVTVLEMDGLRVSRVKAERFDPEEAGVKSEPDTDPTHMSKDITES